MAKLDLSNEVAAFLAKGGVIQKLKPGHTKPPKSLTYRSGNHIRQPKRLVAASK